MNFKYKQVKEKKNVYQANNMCTKAGSICYYQTNQTTGKGVLLDIKRDLIMTKRSVHQEDITIFGHACKTQSFKIPGANTD